MKMVLHIVIAGGLCLMGCRGSSGVVNHKDDMNTNSLSIDVSVTGDATPSLTVKCVAKNISREPLHVFDSSRMPYLLDEHGMLVVLHGVSPPPDDRDLNAIEIPTTRVLAPGDVLSFEVPLVPLRLHGHYDDSLPTPARHGAAAIVCRIAHGSTPIDAAARVRTSIHTLLTWQRLESSRQMTAQFP